MKKLVIISIALLMFASCNKKDSDQNNATTTVNRNNSWCKTTKYTTNYSNGANQISYYSWNGNTCSKKDSTGKILQQTIYNDFGKPLSSTNYNPDGSIGSDALYEYTDCSNWCKITKTTVISNGTSSVNIYTWNGNSYTLKDSTGKILQQANYNQYGRILSLTTYNPDGTLNTIWTYEYTDCTNWCKMTKSIINSSGLQSTNIFTWNGNTCISKDSASAKILQEFIYNDFGKVLTNTHYNPDGGVYYTSTYEYTDCK